MDTLILFDSNFGNTKQVAEHIAEQLGNGASSVSVDDFKETDLKGIKLLIVGSPINAWKPTKKIAGLLNRLDPAMMKGVKGAAFDTRIKSFLSGNAAKKITRALEHAGVNVVASPMGFYVKGNQGPLLDGELKRAEEWTDLIRSRG